MLTSALALAIGLTAAAATQQPGRPGGPPPDPGTWEAAAEIAWYGTWEGGLAEASASGRPILLMSAAPQCRGVPGMW